MYNYSFDLSNILQLVAFRTLNLRTLGLLALMFSFQVF